MIVHPLAFCRTCGVVFEDTGFAFDNVQGVTLQGCRTLCPNGHEAELLAGTFSAIDGVLQVIDGDTFTRAQVENLHRLRERAQQFAKRLPHQPVPDEFIQALDEIIPGSAGAWSLLQKKRYGWAALVLFMSLIIARCGSDAPLVDLSTHNETHYHIEQPLNPQQPSEQENGRRPHTPSDGTQAEDGEGDGGGNINLVHSTTFRRSLLSSTAIGRLFMA